MAYADTPGIRHQIKALRGYQDLYRGLGWTLAGIVPYAGKLDVSISGDLQLIVRKACRLLLMNS